MNGGDLRFHISRKTFTEEAVQFWLAELACAIRYVHKQGIIHRDIKPDNVLLDGDGHVHLADFVSSTAPIKSLFPELTCTECGFRLYSKQASAQQIRNISVLGARGLCGQRLLM